MLGPKQNLSIATRFSLVQTLVPRSNHNPNQAVTALLDRLPEELNHEQVAVTLSGVDKPGGSQGEAFRGENTALSGSPSFSGGVIPGSPSSAWG